MITPLLGPLQIFVLHREASALLSQPVTTVHASFRHPSCSQGGYGYTESIKAEATCCCAHSELFSLSKVPEAQTGRRAWRRRRGGRVSTQARPNPHWREQTSRVTWNDICGCEPEPELGGGSSVLSSQFHFRRRRKQAPRQFLSSVERSGFSGSASIPSWCKPPARPVRYLFHIETGRTRSPPNIQRYSFLG